MMIKLINYRTITIRFKRKILVQICLLNPFFLPPQMSLVVLYKGGPIKTSLKRITNKIFSSKFLFDYAIEMLR